MSNNQQRMALVAAAVLAGVSNAETPVFEPFSSKQGFFVEQFENLERWNPSAATKIDKQQETWSYLGQWKNEEPTVFPGIQGDKGLVATSKAAHHAISSLFEAPYDSEQQGGLVVQYEVKLQNGLECGGAYMKLLTADPEHDISAKELSDKTPFTIMFGPDRCGATNKVHFIFRHKNPLTGEIEEKHLKAPPAPKNDKVSNLYTLIVRKDNTYEIKINNDSKKVGSLLDDFDPPVNPPKQINDPNDTKPSDWVDESMITDPNAAKPDDWDESAPFEIPDEDASMPEGWLENEPATIPDPDAEKPEEWSDEDDGDWIPPSIPNPKCESAPGCGPWTRPSKANPEYKGKWFAPKIDNPAYKGVWAPRKIDNPDYFEDENPYILSPIAGVAFEWWTMQDGIMVDNIYIGNSEKDAADFAAATFDVKKPIEDALAKAAKPATPESDEELDSSDFAISSALLDPVNYTRTKLTTFLKLASRDPIGTFKAMPQAGSIVGALTATLVGMLGILLGLLAPKAPSAQQVKAKSKKVAEDVKAKAEEVKDSAAATAAEVSKNVDGEIKKRTGKGKAAATE